MSDDGGLTTVVTDEVTNQVGISDLLGDGDLVDEIDGGDLGAAVGREFGEQIGRSVGGAIGREIHETLEGDMDDGGLGELRSAVTSGVRTGIQTTIEDLGGQEAIASLAETVSEGGSIEELLDRDESDEDSEESKTDGVEEEADEAEADDAESEADEAEPAEPAAESDADADRSAAELEDLKRETLEDFLGMMAYEDLQSIAKDVGVKANLSRDEMTDRIVETVSGEEDDSGAEETESTTSGAESNNGESTNEEPPQEAE